MATSFRHAQEQDIPIIWQILQDAILRRKKDGSQQWQDGYPNLESVKNDIAKNHGFVLENEVEIIGYVALIINDEPAYKNIEGKWLSNDDFVVFHRIAVAQKFVGHGFSKVILSEIERFAREKGILSVRADTNFDNLAMLSLFKSCQYQYCGEVLMRNSPRKAFEKIL